MAPLLNLMMFVATAHPLPEIVAHRGESFDAPENTMAAFQLAWERNVPAIELDVHVTKDGQIVCCHDADTERVAGKKLIIKDSTLAELQQLDVGSWKGEKWAGERMPTLLDALATIPEKGRCFIEIKTGPEAVPGVVAAIEKSGKRPRQLAIISFKAPTIAECKRKLPEIEAYFLSGFKRDKATGAWTPTIDELIAQAKSLGADGLDLGFEGPHSEQTVAQIKQAGLRFFIWTVDDPQVARRFARWGTEGITTNRGQWLAEQLRDPQAEK